MKEISKKRLKKFVGKEKVVIFAARLKQNGRSLTILKDKYKQVPRTNESRALISLENERRQDKLREIRNIQRRV